MCASVTSKCVDMAYTTARFDPIPLSAIELKDAWRILIEYGISPTFEAQIISNMSSTVINQETEYATQEGLDVTTHLVRMAYVCFNVAGHLM